MKKARLLVVVAIVGAALIARSAYIVASWLFEQQNPATVEVKGSDFALFEDAACTAPLADTVTLDFGDVRPGTPSDTVTFYGKNTGTDVEYPELYQSDLMADLTLYNDTDAVGDSGSPLKLYSVATLTGEFATNTLNGAIDAVTTSVTQTSQNGPALAAYIQIDNELMQVTGSDGATGYVLYVNRAVGGTKAAAHSTGATIHHGTGIVSGDFLEPDEVLTFNLSLEAAEGIATGTEPFSVSVSVESDY